MLQLVQQVPTTGNGACGSDSSIWSTITSAGGGGGGNTGGG